MSLLKTFVLGISSALLLSTVACGGPDPSISDFNKGDNQAKGGFGDGADKNGTLGGTPGDATKKDTGGDLAACATQTAAAVAKPVYLVFMFDKSGSMARNDDGSPSPKWPSATAAAKAFFESADSKGMSASLTFFPDQKDYSCSVSAYDTPYVDMEALPSTSFAAELAAAVPNGGTPTYQAMQGAISYAHEVASGQGKDGSVAIVLVTDGLPEAASCNNESISSVKSLAAGVSATIPTYVIGVGDALTNLNEIASGGGTKSALVISAANPTQIQADFTKAINQIKQSALSCDYGIPAAPAGESFDRAKVNVQHVPTGSTATTIGYNQACTGGTGWKYDDANNPTRILLCDSSCEGVKTSPGRVDILFGCATQAGTVK